MDRMKGALHTILDDANNINVGLMRFTDPGGPILFPVSYIDEDISVVMAGSGGGTEIASVIKLFVGTNDGGIRMTNAENGEEEWIFYPQETSGASTCALT